VRTAIAASARKGRISAETAASAIAGVRGAAEPEAIAGADLVIEAVFENLAVKQQVFARLGALARPGAVLATNTSTLDVDAIAAASGRAGDVVGMHFFSPAHVMRLVEIVRGRETSRATLATALAVTRRIGKIGVTVGNCFGFVGNRMLYAYGREEADAARGRDARADRQGASGLRHGDGPQRGRRPRRPRHRLAGAARVEQPTDDPRFYRVSDLLAELGRFGRRADAASTGTTSPAASGSRTRKCSS
jgi:3-hydroxyacyl-CoA dehydrogenase